MKTLAYRLQFTTPFHLDERGAGFYQHSQRFIRSDTLVAAILSAYKMLDKNIDQTCFEEPPFILSSTFPYLKLDNKIHYFLPRPECSRKVEFKPIYLSFNKDIKNIAWLELDIWERVTNNQWKWDDYCQHRLEIEQLADENKQHKEIYQTIKGELLLRTMRELSDSFSVIYEEKNLRISTDRLTNQASLGLFDFSRIYYRENTGLYFLVKIKNEDTSSFEAALSLLGDMGIGADRSSGHGLFDWTKDEQMQIPKPQNQAIALSLVSPSRDDITDNWLDGAAYDLVKRGGWISGTDYRKKTVRMFTEGSSFQKPLAGCVQNVTPYEDVAEKLGHQIYRDGRGFFVGGEQNG